MKNKLIILFVVAFLLTGCTAGNGGKAEGNDDATDITAWIGNSQNTVLDFDEAAEQPSQEVIEKILKAGINAPSGLNLQEYWISVVTDYDTQMELALTPEFKPQKGTVLLILSVKKDEPSEVDLGILYGYISLAAMAEGYGTHIYGQPARMIPEVYQPKYGIPEGYEPIELVLFGKPAADLNTSVTPGERKENWNFHDPKTAPVIDASDADGTSSATVEKDDE